VLPYRHHKKYKFVLDLRAFGEGRKFFATRAEADAEPLRQIALKEQHTHDAIGLSQREMSRSGFTPMIFVLRILVWVVGA
jgi:hypothetical protein